MSLFKVDVCSYKLTQKSFGYTAFKNLNQNYRPTIPCLCTIGGENTDWEQPLPSGDTKRHQTSLRWINYVIEFIKFKCAIVLDEPTTLEWVVALEMTIVTFKCRFNDDERLYESCKAKWPSHSVFEKRRLQSHLFGVCSYFLIER